MNPDTNRFEPLRELTNEEQVKRMQDAMTPGLNRAQRRKMAQDEQRHRDLVRPDGSPVPKTWTTFSVGEQVAIKGYTFEVTDIGEDRVIFKPVGPQIVGSSTR